MQATSAPTSPTSHIPALDQPPATSQQTDTAAAAAGSRATVGDASTSGDDIIVTGIIGSLARNLDLKRNSPGVVDVISAEDIGKFPDANVASALQRLPGVTIQRSGSRGDATGISIRGFGGGFVDTLYDGRHISTATGNRGVDFTTVGSDFVGRLSVLKTPDVALSTSAIGGTVDIAFPKPFDRDGLHIAATVSGTMQSRNKDVRPTAGVLVSDTFADDKFGILADIAYSRRDTTTNNTGTTGWVGITLYPCQRTASCNLADFTPAAKETKPAWFPQRTIAGQETTQDARVDGRVAIQWRPTDTILFTLDDNYSRQNLQTSNGQYAAWFNGTDLRNVKTDANGTIIDFNQFGVPNDLIAARTRNILRTNQTGLNMKWEVIEHLTLDLDGAYSKSVRNPGRSQRNDSAFLGYGGTNPDPNGPFLTLPCTYPAGATATTPPISCTRVNTVLGANTGLTILGNSNKYIPQIHDYGPRGNVADFASQTLSGSHVFNRGGAYNTDAVKQVRGSLNWDTEELKLTLGGQYIEDKLYTETTNTGINGVSNARSGYGPQSGRAGGATGGLTQAAPGTFLPYVSTKDFFPGYEGNLAPVIPNFDPYKVFSALEVLGPTAPALDPGTVLGVRERTVAIFFKTSFENEVAGMPFRISAGVRRESTNLQTRALGRILLGLYRPPGDPTLIAPDPSLGPNRNGYSNPQPVFGKNKYNYLLPSLDLKVDVASNLVVRADASRTLTRPALNALRPTVVPSTLRVGTLAATGGNTQLSPYLSDNYDLGIEWYYQKNSYFAINGYVKNITDFIVGGVQSLTINNVLDPTTGQVARFNTALQVNGPSATVKGVELAWQQIFGNSGFGFSANATFPQTNRKFDSKNITGTGFSVPGLAKSANFVGFYDKHGFQIRGAVNWRDEYLLQLGQGSTGAFGAEPVYVNRQLQVDASTSWDINEHFTVFGEITNINNSTYSTHGRFKNQLLDLWSYGRRYTAGARFHL